MTRADRVAELIKHEVSDIITRKLSDPRIGFTSVTAVDIGSDLQNAKIYVSIFGTPDEKKTTMAALFSATKFVRRELSCRLQLRDVPEIIFRQDDSIEKGARVFEIINKLHKETEEVKGTSEKEKRKNAGSNKSGKKR
ncbi:MAG: 30S ribosome-binding factor RbfA [bacterium]